MKRFVSKYWWAIALLAVGVVAYWKRDMVKGWFNKGQSTATPPPATGTKPATQQRVIQMPTGNLALVA